MILSFLPVNFVSVSALSDSGFTIVSADGVTALTEGTDYSYSDRVLTVKTTTPVVIGMNNNTTSTDEVIIADSTKGAVNITFDGINIDTIKDNAIELNGNNQTTFTFTGTNTLKAGNAGISTNSTPLKITSTDNGELNILGVKCGIGTTGSKPGKPLEISGNIKITIPEGPTRAIYNNVSSVTISGTPIIDADVVEHAVYGVGLEFSGGTFTIKNDSGFAIASGDYGGTYQDIIIKGNADIPLRKRKEVYITKMLT